ncbi:MAG: hypothetical protein Q9212_003405 [Teloschistes hypoglaucus]
MPPSVKKMQPHLICDAVSSMTIHRDNEWLKDCLSIGFLIASRLKCRAEEKHGTEAECITIIACSGPGGPISPKPGRAYDAKDALNTSPFSAVMGIKYISAPQLMSDSPESLDSRVWFDGDSMRLTDIPRAAVVIHCPFPALASPPQPCALALPRVQNQQNRHYGQGAETASALPPSHLSLKLEQSSPFCCHYSFSKPITSPSQIVSPFVIPVFVTNISSSHQPRGGFSALRIQLYETPSGTRPYKYPLSQRFLTLNVYSIFWYLDT